MKLKAALIVVATMLPGLAAWSQEHPKIEVAIDYSYLHYGAIDFDTANADYGRAINLNGGGGSVVLDLRRMFGLKAEFQGYASGTANLIVPPGSPYLPAGGAANISGNLFTYMFGPVIGKRYGVFRPYGQVLIGGAHSNAYTNAYSDLKFQVSKAPANDAFSLDLGIGLDIAVSPRFAIRPFEVSWLRTGFNNAFSLNQESFRALAGVVLNFGGAAPLPLGAACSVSPTEVLPWDGPVTATVQPSNFNPNHALVNAWNSTSGPIIADGNSAKVDTTTLSPGPYTVTDSVSDPKLKKLAPAGCSATFTVKAPRPPVLTCSAEPSTVEPGQSVTLTARGASPDQQRLKDRSFSASAGSVRESQTSAGSEPGSFVSTAILDTTGVGTGTVNLTLNVTDVHGLTGSCVTSVNVQAPTPQRAPEPKVVGESLIGECAFNNDQRAARVDNECKASLDAVALRLQQDPQGRVVIVGYGEDEEASRGKDLPAYRAYNCKTYLTAGEAKQGIDPSRVEVRESSTHGQGKAAKFYFVPSGGQFTLTDTSVVDESQMPKNTMGRRP